MFSRISTLIMVTLIFSFLFFVRVNADDPATYNSKSDLTYALGVLNSREGLLRDEWRALEKLEVQQAMLGIQWDDNREDMIENAVNAAKAIGLDILGSVTSIIADTSLAMQDLANAHALAVALVNKTLEIESQNAVVATAVGVRNGAHAHYKAHFDAYLKDNSGSELEFYRNREDAVTVVYGGLCPV